MAELTTLDSKLGEVLGLAMAAKDATEKIEKLVDDEHVAKTIRRMHGDAAKVEELGTELVGLAQFAGKKTAILEQARTTRHEVAEMRDTYLGDDADGLDGLEFLTMSEAAEVGHWKVVEKLNEQVGDRDIKELTDFVVPMQEGHLATALEDALLLAAQEDALAPA